MSNAVYEIVNERILRLLEEGTVPWHQPWTTPDRAPRNLDGRRYRGVNVWLLAATAQDKGYRDPRWLTFRQAKEHGGSVRKGEKAAMVVFWKMLDRSETNTDTGELEDKHIPMLRYYNVFNLEQCDGVQAATLPTPEPKGPALAAGQRIVAGMPNAPRLVHGDAHAYYRPATDEIHLPDPADFSTMDAYYATTFHELVHSTGHKSRLDREGVAGSTHGFGSHPYGREELVAEMGAAYLCAEAGIVNATAEASASYLASWVKTIQEDVRAVVVAAGKAQKAADYILNVQAASDKVAA